MTHYQTIPLPTGVREGLFPTIDWFQNMQIDVDFKGKTVLDLGCNEFSYGIQALLAGAKRVIGVDTNGSALADAHKHAAAHNLSVVTIESKIEDLETISADIVIFSMIIHHLEDPEIHIKRFFDAATDKVVFIYRNEFPGKPENGLHPLPEELDEIVGEEFLFQTTLMHTDKQYIKVSIYDKKSFGMKAI